MCQATERWGQLRSKKRLVVLATKMLSLHFGDSSFSEGVTTEWWVQEYTELEQKKNRSRDNTFKFSCKEEKGHKRSTRNLD